MLHRLDGSVEFIQCKRYAKALGVSEILDELAKLCVNTFEKKLPIEANHVSFYVIPDLQSDAQDLVGNRRTNGKRSAGRALRNHLRKDPSQPLVEFAHTWWPNFDRATEQALTARVMLHPDVLDRFFAVKKVIDATREDIQADLKPLHDKMDRLSEEVRESKHDRVANTVDIPTNRAQQLVSERREGHLESRLRRSLDAEGQRLWEEVRSNIHGLDTVNAVEARPELEKWFAGDGSFASPVIRGRVAVLLSDLAIIESSLKSGGEHVDTTSARTWFERAADAFGENPSPEDASRLLHVESRILWIDHRHADALKILKNAEDVNCRSLLLSIYLEEEDSVSAAEIARGLPLDEQPQVDRLAFVYARNGLEDEAQQVFAWTQLQAIPLAAQRCTIGRVHGALQRFLAANDRQSLLAGSRTPDDIRHLRSMIDRLQPLLVAVLAQGRPMTGRDDETVQLAFTISEILRDVELIQKYGSLLSKARRVPLEYARAVCREDLPPDSAVPDRLRKDYPSSFAARHTGLRRRSDQRRFVQADPVGGRRPPPVRPRRRPA